MKIKGNEELDTTQFYDAGTPLATSAKAQEDPNDKNKNDKAVDLKDSELKLAQNITQSETLKKTIYLFLLALISFFAIVGFLYFKNRQKKNHKIHKLETELISAELW